MLRNLVEPALPNNIMETGSHSGQTTLWEAQKPTIKRPFEDTLEFLRLAREEGVCQAVLSGADGYEYDSLALSLSIVDAYFDTDDSASDIGPRFHLSTSPVLKRKAQGMALIHENSPKELQERFPFSELRLAKPKSAKARLRTSVARGSNALEIADSVSTGSTAMGLMFEFGLNYEQLSARRRILKELKVHVPHCLAGMDTAREVREAFENPDLSDNQKQVLLDKIKTSYYRSNIGADGTLVTLKEVVEDAGFRYTNNQERYFDVLDKKVPKGFIQSKKRNGNGISHKRRFLFRADKKRAIDIVKRTRSLRDLKVRQQA